MQFTLYFIFCIMCRGVGTFLNGTYYNVWDFAQNTHPPPEVLASSTPTPSKKYFLWSLSQIFLKKYPPEDKILKFTTWIVFK